MGLRQLMIRIGRITAIREIGSDGGRQQRKVKKAGAVSVAVYFLSTGCQDNIATTQLA